MGKINSTKDLLPHTAQNINSKEDGAKRETQINGFSDVGTLCLHEGMVFDQVNKRPNWLKVGFE
jgi:hypothetical protein